MKKYKLKYKFIQNNLQELLSEVEESLGWKKEINIKNELLSYTFLISFVCFIKLLIF